MFGQLKTQATAAIIYCRYSPRRNADKCESIEYQQKICNDYCKQQNYRVVGTFNDEALSGSDHERPGLWHAMDACGKGMVLLVHRMDRLSRDVYLAEILHRQAKNKGSRIEAVEGSINGDSPEQVMIRQVLQAFSEYERKVIAARTKVAMLCHQAAGRRMSHRTPYGYDVNQDDPSRLIENPNEQATIDLIRDYHIEGHGLRQICRKLTNRGLACRGGHWHHSTVKNILHRSINSAASG
jgi:site-specific DNA recombinase